MVNDEREPIPTAGWQMVPAEPTPEMVTAYLNANDAYWRDVDALPTDPTKSCRQGTPREATCVSLKAALSAAPNEPK